MSCSLSGRGLARDLEGCYLDSADHLETRATAWQDPGLAAFVVAQPWASLSKSWTYPDAMHPANGRVALPGTWEGRIEVSLETYAQAQ